MISLLLLLTSSLSSCQSQIKSELLSFQMVYIDDCNALEALSGLNGPLVPGRTEAREACLAGSKLWRRDSRFFGSGTTSYDVVQAVHGDGEKIQPAWDNFVEAQVDCPKPVVERRYRNTFTSLSTKASKSSGKGAGSTGGFCHCSYTDATPYGFDDVQPWEDLSPFKVDVSSSKKRGLKTNHGGANVRGQSKRKTNRRQLQKGNICTSRPKMKAGIVQGFQDIDP